MAVHSSILAQRIPWTEKPGGLQSMRLQESDTTWQLNHHHHLKAHSPVEGEETEIAKHKVKLFKNGR